MEDGVYITKIDIDSSKIEHFVDSLIDNQTMLEIHTLFAKMCDPYVPMKEGVLSQDIDITYDGVHYVQPYAHYQYTGEKYSPSIPIIEKGQLVGFFSPKGQKKNPTGEPLNYSKELHPLATKEWDKAMMSDRGDEFIAGVRAIIERRAKELYG